jgi:hypothetical protein
MNITIFGYKLRVLYIVLAILLIWFINTNTFFSCAGGVKPGVKVIKEGFSLGGNIVEGMAQKVKKTADKASVEAKKVVKKAVVKTAQENAQQ